MTGLEILPLTIVGVIILIALAFGVIAKRIGQNPIIGFIVAGAVMGPVGLGFLHPTQPLIQSFAEIGLFIVLFYLGLELSVKDYIEAGKTTLGIAIINILGLLVVGAGISLVFGYSLLFSLIVGFMMFSTSTAIVIKFAIDNNIIDRQDVKLSVSTLILQDFLGILLVVFLTNQAGEAGPFSLSIRGIVFAVAAFYVVYQLSKKVEKWLESHGFGHTEITLYALGIGMLIATLAGILNLAVSIGAYFAGFALATTGARKKIRKDINFLRDFFLLFFFVGFGTTLFFDVAQNRVIIPPLESLLGLILLGILLTIGIVLVNSFVLAFFGPLFGISKKEGSVSALLLIPLGEFVVIIATAGQTVLGPREATIIPVIAFFLIVLSILVFQPLYRLVPLHQKLVQKIPTPFKIPPFFAGHKPDTPQQKNIKQLLVNAFVVMSMGWMALLLFNDLPRFGIPIFLSREITTLAIFAVFAFYPVLESVRAFKKILLHP
jgi:monovalent cation:H+ antiporter-2, CPA2 family